MLIIATSFVVFLIYGSVNRVIKASIEQVYVKREQGIEEIKHRRYANFMSYVLGENPSVEEFLNNSVSNITYEELLSLANEFLSLTSDDAISNFVRSLTVPVETGSTVVFDKELISLLEAVVADIIMESVATDGDVEQREHSMQLSALLSVLESFPYPMPIGEKIPGGYESFFTLARGYDELWLYSDTYEVTLITEHPFWGSNRLAAWMSGNSYWEVNSITISRVIPPHDTDPLYVYLRNEEVYERIIEKRGGLYAIHAFLDVLGESVHTRSYNFDAVVVSYDFIVPQVFFFPTAETNKPE